MSLAEGTGIRSARIAGVGSYLPERVLTNQELETMVDTTDEWIRTRTGIRQRHVARDDQASSDLGAEAAKRAMADAGVEPEEIDCIIVASITPDMQFPSTACFVQELIGAKNAYCFDIQAACSGFLYGLETARNYIACGSADTVLVIGAEKLSCITDWEDRATCVLFGDGAGAVVVKPTEEGQRGILGTVMGSDGALGDLLKTPAGGSRMPASHETVDARLHYLQMNGREVFKHAVRCMCDAGCEVLEKCGVSVDDVKCVVPHQANMRIIKAIADRFGCEQERFYMNLERVGNMSSASVPVALDEVIRAGRLERGDIVLFVAFGGGFTWGAMAVEW